MIMDNIYLSKKEEQSIKAVLLKSIHKVAEKVKEGYLVWIPEFKEIAEKSSHEYPLWLWVDSINYTHNDQWFPTIEVYCSYYRKNKFRASFYMGRPHGTYNDQSPIPYAITVEKFISYDENIERGVWEEF